MFKKGKRMSLAVLLLVGILLLTACGKNDTSGQGTGEGNQVSINALFMKQAGYSEEDIKNMTAEFMEKNPDIKVNTTFLAYEALHDKIVTSSASGAEVFDVVPVDDIWTAEFAQAGFIKDVSGRVTEEMKSDIFPEALKAFAFKGKNFGLPWNNDTKYFFYNKKILAEAGYAEPPTTWQEFFDMAKAMKEKGIGENPSIWSWSQAEALIVDYVIFLKGFGGEMLDESYNPVFNQEAGVKALQFMVDLQKSGLAAPGSTQSLEEDVRRVFSQGSAAFALNWTYMYNLAKDPNESKVVDDVAVAVTPGTEEGKPASIYGALGLAVSSATQNEEAAWEYIEFLTSKEIQKKYAALSLPIWKSLYDDPELVAAQPELIKVAKEQYQNVFVRPRVAWYPELSQVLQVEIQNALTSKKTPQQALDDAAKQVEAIKTKYTK